MASLSRRWEAGSEKSKVEAQARSLATNRAGFSAAVTSRKPGRGTANAAGPGGGGTPGRGGRGRAEEGGGGGWWWPPPAPPARPPLALALPLPRPGRPGEGADVEAPAPPRAGRPPGPGDASPALGVPPAPPSPLPPAPSPSLPADLRAASFDLMDRNMARVFEEWGACVGGRGDTRWKKKSQWGGVPGAARAALPGGGGGAHTRGACELSRCALGGVGVWTRARCCRPPHAGV